MVKQMDVVVDEVVVDGEVQHVHNGWLYDFEAGRWEYRPELEARHAGMSGQEIHTHWCEHENGQAYDHAHAVIYDKRDEGATLFQRAVRDVILSAEALPDIDHPVEVEYDLRRLSASVDHRIAMAKLLFHPIFSWGDKAAINIWADSDHASEADYYTLACVAQRMRAGYDSIYLARESDI